MKKIIFLAGCVLLSVSSGFAAEQLAPGYTPDMKSTEGGIWANAERAERDIAQSPLRLRDDAIEAYIKQILCRLASAHCNSLRFYILADPRFNASVYPNGCVIVNTGLLLRLENEAQLAAVLGHEIIHYLNRHSLDRTESQRDTGNALAFLSLGLAGVGVGYRVNLSSVTDLAALIATGALFSYSRGHETESDELGLKLGIAAGYDPTQASIVWKDIEAEYQADPDRPGRSLFFESHPAPTNRMKTLARLAEEAGDKSAFLGADEYRAVFSKFRPVWLEQELNLAQYEQTLHVLARLITANPSDALLRFYQGETYRRRNAKGDLPNAIKSYREALALNNVPLAAWRGLGLTALKAGDKPAAREGLGRYLELVPAAEDRAMVELYLSNLEQ